MAQSNDQAQDVPESPEQARKRFVVPSFAYVAHYTPFVTRKQHIFRMLEHEKIRPVFIESFDREVLTDADTMRFCLTRLKLGHVSLTCKHVEVWRRIANDPENDFGIVFEDDVIVTFLFVETLQTYLDQLPHDFDLFMINSGCNLRIPKDQLKPNKLVYWRGTHETSWGGLGGTRCSDGYVMSKRCAKALVDMYESHGPSSIPVLIDHWLNVLLHSMQAKVYWAEPPICWQGSELGLFKTDYQ